jgi:ribosomal protein S21
MAIYAVKHGDESNDRLFQRFKKQVQKTGLVRLLRERNVHKKKPNRRARRLRALVREGFRTERRKKQFYSNM